MPSGSIATGRSMTERCFFDTNVLAYAADRDGGAKQKLARGLIQRHQEERTLVVSVQVLQEYFEVLTRKFHAPLEEARAGVLAFSAYDVVIADAPLVLAAIDLHGRHRLSIWDALILKAAEIGGCTTVYSEDLQHGQLIDGVRVQNPFR